MPADEQLVGNRYQIQDQIGEGSFGAVYRAQDRLTGTTIALKQVTTPTNQLQFGSQGDGLRQDLALAQEFRILASLRHPHIITVLDYGFNQDHQPYFTMELLENPKTILEAGQGQSVEAQVRLLIELLQALTYLHRRGILHRDLKPANVLVTEQGRVKVLDFGLSTTVDQAKGSGGTLLYMAPEVLRGQQSTHAADLFAVGVLGYQLFSGRYPFDQQRPSRIISSILHRAPDITAIDHPQLAGVVMSCLEKDPATRIHDADALVVALANAIGQPSPQESIAIRESFLQTAPFVGRDAEFAQLTRAQEQAGLGQGSSWLIGGESGIGKSRLLDELRAHALVSGATVLHGQAVENGGLPYQLWRNPIRRLVLSTDLSDLDAGILKEIVPDIAMLLGREIPEVPILDGIAGQQRLALTIAGVFRQQTQPILLLLEDLQWAAESLDVLKQLSRIVSELPLLLVANYRNDDRPDLPDVLPGTELIHLTRFSETSMAELSASMLGESGSRPEILDFLSKETEGNAFFLVEVVRALAEEVGRLSDVGQVALPQQVFTGGIQQVVQRRLGKVPGELQPLLKLAAIIGREIDPTVLALTSEAEHVQDWLTVCANAEILEIHDDHWYFAHDKLRYGVLNSVPDRERSELHGQVALAIEKAYPEDDQYAAILADHWHHAQNRTKEAHYSRLAGEWALSINSLDEAITRFERGLHLLEDQKDSQDRGWQAQILHQLGLVYERQGLYDRSSACMQHSLTIARELDEPKYRLDALVGLGQAIHRQGRFDEAMNYLGEALEIARQGENPHARTGANMWLGACYGLQGDRVQAYQHLQEALTTARTIQDPALIARIRNLLGENKRLEQQYPDAIKHYTEALTIYQTQQNLFGICLVSSNMGHALRSSDQIAHAVERYATGMRLAIQMDLWGGTVEPLIGIAGIRADQHPERAVEWISLAMETLSGAVEIQNLAQPILEQLQSVLVPSVYDAAFERGKSLDLKTVVPGILSELTDQDS